ncbi:MAG: hypothetical protein GY708_10815 [Actinomycetia bacterium]|nr:hypothetical protein [Actinomycetes bacterium]MCP4960849.1 hypothetical protein [Actinomycetes bacterium]
MARAVTSAVRSPGTLIEPFDFRRPSKFSREHMRGFEAVHEVFARRVSSGLSHRLRTVVTVSHFSTDQITYEDFQRSMPTPSVVATIDPKTLPGVVIFEMSLQLALAFVDRVLGGAGDTAPQRGPTEIEAGLIRQLMGPIVDAFEETLEPVKAVEPEVESIEFNPRLVQAIQPNDMVLLLTYSVAMNGGAEGLVSICYPFDTIEPVLDRLDRKVRIQGASADDGAATIEPLVPEVMVPVSFQLRSALIPAGELAVLAPGDVIKTDHRVDEPAVGVVGGDEVLLGRLGRNGRRLAVQISSWRTP